MKMRNCPQTQADSMQKIEQGAIFRIPTAGQGTVQTLPVTDAPSPPLLSCHRLPLQYDSDKQFSSAASLI